MHNMRAVVARGSRRFDVEPEGGCGLGEKASMLRLEIDERSLWEMRCALCEPGSVDARAFMRWKKKKKKKKKAFVGHLKNTQRVRGKIPVLIGARYKHVQKRTTGIEETSMPVLVPRSVASW